MNLLTRVKSKNRYNYITDNLYKEVVDEETQEIIYEPITDIESETALLTTDGTSWQFSDDEWVRIEQDLDVRILENIYLFISSICQSIHNSFVDYCSAEEYLNITVEYKENDKNILVLNNIENSNFIEDDFVVIVDEVTNRLTKVLKYKNNTLELDNRGVDFRVTGNTKNIALAPVKFSPSFLMAVLDMFGYDLFERDAKEKRQERLGNYTYTNFEPTVYNGEGAYPKQLENAIKYWQRVYV